MTHDERNLLLTVAQILRNRSTNEVHAERREDHEALTRALAPFESEGQPATGSDANIGK